MEPKSYTVCFLFTPDLKSVLLVKKDRTDFKGRLNGVGGKVEPGETPEECAIREIREETSVTNLRRLAWLGTLLLPRDCAATHATGGNPTHPACTLHYFGGILADPGDVVRPEGAEALYFSDVGDVLAADVHDARYAGNGDLPYFVNQAMMKFGAT